MLSWQQTVALIFLATAVVQVTAKASIADLRRAVTKVPRKTFKGTTFSDMNAVLNKHLMRIQGLRLKSCSNFTMHHLQSEVLEPIFEHADVDLLSLYALQNDNRKRAHASIEDARAEWSRLAQLIEAHPELHDKRRDGLCHEAVMWFVHHLTAERREHLALNLILPLLPEGPRHEESSTKGDDAAHVAIHQDYESKVSCQQCHSGPTWKSWEDATLPTPLPVYTPEPGRERRKSCDYQNTPPCGPCEGLGGPRIGDALDEFVPVNCSVVAEAKDVPVADRPAPVFPSAGHASIHGDTRQPLEVRPSKPGTYPKIDSTITLAWDDKVMRHRYDFAHFPPFNSSSAQIYLQKRGDRNTTGVMVTIMGKEHSIPSLCVCTSGVAGVMHLDAFAPHGKDDPVDLPPQQGGVNYLGRIRIQLDGAEKRTAIADHYMKWAFHFLVDADKNSPGYGFPLRLYGAMGVRFVYSNWTTTDPTFRDPALFTIPKVCVPLSKNCFEHFPPEMWSMDESRTQYV